MRKWHRWITVFFGVFMFWIAATGVLSHVAALWPAGAPSPEAAARATPPEGWACPEGWRCSPPRETSGMRSLVGLFHHLHSGETFGPVGTAISLASGFALLFFAVSGLWMYIQMFRQRRRIGRKQMFWK
ncbi:MAG: PepSY domain-containing protein [Sphingobium sp.]|nr:PepSY domain-containing protein [Sphingobium sp.]MBP6112436.1 PepSY domain-containing protein [Sphingobium sp.]MBP8671125.1 PepSY domain-containing protein [Sphingobium sp.]MBP9157055.1 PepSY domain-containing protein [Sphingobium sp.]MCC6480824.1 PepSY domain-containing protein [Sphingomonadaceae bacterium]